MARPRKSGLDYFPFDTDFFSDEKVVCIGGEYGVKGELTIIRLLCAVYRNGYFALWNDNLKYKLKREMDGVSAELLDQIVQALVRRGFFDRSLFSSDSVLTSEGIQRRYFEATRLRERGPDLPYLLVPLEQKNAPKNISNKKTTVSNEETPVSNEEMTQIKRNKKKRNRISSGDDIKASPSPSPFIEERFIKEFFGEEETEAASGRRAAIQNLSLSLGYPSAAAMKEACVEILNGWTLRRHQPQSWEDAASHLISTLRKKASAGSCPSPPGVRPVKESASVPRKAARGAEEAACSCPGSVSVPRKAACGPEEAAASRREEWERRQREAEKPADLIRRRGYDPAEVTLVQVLNPEWCERNPPKHQPQ